MTSLISSVELSILVFPNSLTRTFEGTGFGHYRWHETNGADAPEDWESGIQGLLP